MVMYNSREPYDGDVWSLDSLLQFRIIIEGFVQMDLKEDDRKWAFRELCNLDQEITERQNSARNRNHD